MISSGESPLKKAIGFSLLPKILMIIGMKKRKNNNKLLIPVLLSVLSNDFLYFRSLLNN